MSALVLPGSPLGAELEAARELGDGPIRWWLVQAERRELADIEHPDELEAFFEEVMLRRAIPNHPVWSDPEAEFERRVDAADLLYAEPKRRGALTDRGRALIVLGSPNELRLGHRVVPGVSHRIPGSTRQMVPIREEVWLYDWSALDPRIRSAASESEVDRVMLVFLAKDDRTVLHEGEKILKQATRALAGVDP